MDTVRASGLAFLFCSVLFGYGEGTPSIPNTPDGAVTAVARGLADNNASYAWRSSRLRIAGGGRPKTPVACDKSLDNHEGKGICVLYLDGSVEFIPVENLGEGGLEEFLLRHHLSK